MTEVGGLVLGAVSLLPVFITVSNKVKELYDGYSQHQETIQNFLDDLQIQDGLLQKTFNNIGLMEPKEHEVHTCFETRFPSKALTLKKILKRIFEITDKYLKELGVDPKQPDTLPQESGFPRFKRSLKIRKCTKLIAQLDDLNKQLYSLTEQGGDLPVEDDTRVVCGLTSCFNPRGCQELRQHLTSLHGTLAAACLCDCNCPLPHQVAIDLDWLAFQSASTAVQWTFSVGISYGTPSMQDGPSRWRRLHITNEKEEILATPASSEAAQLTPSSPARSPSPSRNASPASERQRPKQRVAIAPTPMPLQSSSGPPTPAASPTPHISSLCAAVRVGGKPWTVAGLLRGPGLERPERGHFSVVHAAKLAPIAESVPLKELLTKRLARRAMPLPRVSNKQRLGIAAGVAWSVLHLSEGPWLGHQWRDEQLCVFLETHAGDLERYARHPSVTCVLDSPEAPRVAEMQHQEPSNDSIAHMIPNMTIFTLGIILIELALGQPFAQIYKASGSGSGGSSGSAAEAQGSSSLMLLLDSYIVALRTLDKVSGTFGDSYGYAVERCIRFAFPGEFKTSNFQEESFLSTFYGTVVAPIQAAYEQMPPGLVVIE